MKKSNKTRMFGAMLLSGSLLMPLAANADDNAATLIDAFKQGAVKGQLKSYFFAQSFDGEGLNDSEIWVNGGNLSYKTAAFHGFGLGTTFQASFVGHKDDEDGKTAGTLDTDGAQLSEAYLAYTYANTNIKLERQYISGYPLLSGSGSRMIRESFTGYLVKNEDVPGTVLTAGLVTEYQTRTDKSRYGDGWFVEFEQNGTGDVGDFYDIGDDGMIIFHAKNSSVSNLTLQFMYANVLDALIGYYADAKYTLDVQFKPYLAGQIYFADYDDDTMDSNEMFGLKAGMKVSDFDIFAGYTASGGAQGDARVFRGLGQGAYYHYTATTKTSGSPSFEADTDAYQIGTAYKYKGLSSKLRFTIFDAPAENGDIDEYTLNLAYKFNGRAEGFSVSLDFSILDYENDDKDATDLRTKLIYSF